MAASITDTTNHKKILLWQHYASRITPGVQRVVEFAKRVPGFCDFSQDDQLILIKLGFFEVWLCHVTKLATDSSLTFDDGSYLSREQLELLYDVSIKHGVGYSKALMVMEGTTKSGVQRPHPTSLIHECGAPQTILNLFSE